MPVRFSPGTATRVLDLGEGVAVTVRGLDVSAMVRLMPAALNRAREEIRRSGVAAPSDRASARLAIFYLERLAVLEAVLGWDGVDDGEGNVPPITEETWAQFSRLRPDMALRVVTEIGAMSRAAFDAMQAESREDARDNGTEGL